MIDQSVIMATDNPWLIMQIHVQSFLIMEQADTVLSGIDNIDIFCW